MKESRMPLDAPGKYSANRLFEWVSAIGMLNTGLVLMIWPHTLAAGNLRPLLHVLAAGELTAIYCSLGVIRAATLILNGRLDHWGPKIRAAMASVSCIVWLQMIAALWLQLGQPSMITGILIALAGGEFRSVVRARRDLDGG
jgi:hypothetical protein